MRIRRAFCVAVAVLSSLTSSLDAQVRASERAGVFQVVDGTRITVEYSRPQARGRSPIFGAVIPWGKVWTPGANWATTFEADKDVMVNGHALTKGAYSVWMEVQPTEWTVIFDPKSRAFHNSPPKPDSSQLRFAVTPENLAGPDMLTWSFTEVSTVGTVLRMAWAGKSVTLQVTVPRVPPPALAASLAGRYTGNYTIQFGPASATGAEPAPGAGEPPGLIVTYADGRLLADWAHPPFDVWNHLVFIKIADNWFHPAALVDGAIYDEVTDLVFEFGVTDGRATRFEIRGPGDRVVGRGSRIP